MLDFAALREKRTTFEQLTYGLTAGDLHSLTDEMIDTQLSLIADAIDADVVFLPEDPQAKDQYAQTAQEINMPWTLGHVIVHITASSEEAAAHSSQLARGVPTSGRCRSEVPWESVTTIAQVRQRLEESRRMRHAFLHTWPDQPDLENVYLADHKGARPRNALQRFAAGLAHDDAHLEQIAEIMRQARLARLQFA